MRPLIVVVPELDGVYRVTGLAQAFFALLAAVTRLTVWSRLIVVHPAACRPPAPVVSGARYVPIPLPGGPVAVEAAWPHRPLAPLPETLAGWSCFGDRAREAVRQELGAEADTADVLAVGWQAAPFLLGWSGVGRSVLSVDLLPTEPAARVALREAAGRASAVQVPSRCWLAAVEELTGPLPRAASLPYPVPEVVSGSAADLPPAGLAVLKNRLQQSVGLTEDRRAMVLVMCARASADDQKNHALVLGSADRLLRDHREVQLIVAPFGATEQEVRAGFDGLRVLFPGRVASPTGPCWPGVVVGADLFLCPSRRDPFALTPVQAMAAGCVALLSDLVGCATEPPVERVTIEPAWEVTGNTFVFPLCPGRPNLTEAAFRAEVGRAVKLFVRRPDQYEAIRRRASAAARGFSADALAPRFAALFGSQQE